MAGVSENQGQLVFGLDIGTRSIVGTVGYRKGEHFCVAAQRFKEHETRAMLDGQIHDINKVGETIRQVKQLLEADIGRHLSEVCIAAAGRVLRTVTVFVEQEMDADKEIAAEDVYSLDTMGVEKAYEEFIKENETEMKFYCVGYTPMRYYMNGYQIGNLEGHKAKRIGVDLIATFLPDDVVDGLYKSVEVAGLEVVNMTLEPIAAIQVAIPEKFRMLNMALVDVGAGTSDISITKEGTITAYGMIPVAGDSLTDILVQHCLVDFDTAEQIKRQAGVAETIEYLDIMGLSQTISSEEVLSLLSDAVRNMTKMVAECILNLNGDKPVSAVFVVGGGGMIPGYTELLAEALGIVKERVAIRGEEVLKTIEFDREDARKDSLMVTPVGICLSYYEQSNSFIFAAFNDMRVKLYDNGRLAVADAAMQAQFPNDSLFPRRGEALTFTVNGKTRIVRGTQGEAAVITINGQPADITTRIHNGDRVQVIASTVGDPGEMELRKLPELAERLQVIVNGSKIELPRTASVNGILETEYYSIKNGDDIIINNCYTVDQIAEIMDVSLAYEGDILVNDTPAHKDTKVYENFTVNWELLVERTVDNPASEYVPFHKIEDSVPVVNEGEKQLQETSPIQRQEQRGSRGHEVQNLTASLNSHINRKENESQSSREKWKNNGQSAEERIEIGRMPTQEPDENWTPYERSVRTAKQLQDGVKTTQNSQPCSITVNVNHLPVSLTGKPNYVFVDIFNYIDFDLNASNGRSIVTNLNGRPAEYMEALENGDVIDIYWK